jgi:hypothetical protein
VRDGMGRSVKAILMTRVANQQGEILRAWGLKEG